jgi:DNA/RNA-binding domain of Phe-tRNA-synthetase-like protein
MAVPALRYAGHLRRALRSGRFCSGGSSDEELCMLEISATERVATRYPGAVLGALAMCNLRNPAEHAELAAAKADLEQELRARFGGLSRAELRAAPVLEAYTRYYRGFGNTYHVQGQLESVVSKGRPIPSVAALVETMFMAELKNQILTAAHDLATVQPPLAFDVVGDDPLVYTTFSGRETSLKPGDIYQSDAGGVICSILYGQDQRTRVTAGTTAVLYIVYAPPGVGRARVEQHLHDIEYYVHLVAPDAATELLATYP